MTTTPPIGSIVTYVTAAIDSHQAAIVVGYCDVPAELDLAVLAVDGQRLDLLALSVPYSSQARPGTWHTEPVTWPEEQEEGEGDG